MYQGSLAQPLKMGLPQSRTRARKPHAQRADALRVYTQTLLARSLGLSNVANIAMFGDPWA